MFKGDLEWDLEVDLEGESKGDSKLNRTYLVVDFLTSLGQVGPG